MTSVTLKRTLGLKKKKKKKKKQSRPRSARRLMYNFYSVSKTQSNSIDLSLHFSKMWRFRIICTCVNFDIWHSYAYVTHFLHIRLCDKCALTKLLRLWISSFPVKDAYLHIKKIVLPSFCYKDFYLKEEKHTELSYVGFFTACQVLCQLPRPGYLHPPRGWGVGGGTKLPRPGYLTPHPSCLEKNG